MKKIISILIGISLITSCSSENTEIKPTITTNPVTLTFGGNATSGGEITDNGGAKIKTSGIVWGTDPNPTINLNTKTTDGLTSGHFTSTISGLISGTTYYLRAYATNTYGTYYGNQITFTETTVPLNGLVGFWPFNGNANDISVNNNNGTVNGPAIPTTDRFENENSAYRFDGNSYIIIPDSNSLKDLTSITISSWIKIYSWDYIGNIGYFPILHKSDKQSQYGKYALNLKTSGVISHLDTNETGIIYDFSINTWYHIVNVISSNRTDLYINGVLSYSNYSGLFPQTVVQNLPLIIGKDMPGVIEYTNGKIDDIGIWNRALSPEEIITLYKSVK